MLRNYFKIALRNLWKNRGYSAINIFGLAVGLATCLLILIFVMDELSYDRYNKKADRIYRVDSEINLAACTISWPLCPTRWQRH
jgi:putative ABC transport system permease protein